MIAATFHLPDADLLRQHVDAHAPRSSRWSRLAPLGVLVAGLFVLLFAPPSAVTAMLPWALLGGLVVWLHGQKRKMFEAQRGVRGVLELTALRRPRDAESVAWHLLPDLQRWPDMHVQGVLLLGANLMALRAWEPAIEAQDYLLDHIPEDHPTAHLLRAQRAMALLHEDRLVDADTEIRALRRAPLDDPTAAALAALAELYQQMKTNHHADALAQAEHEDPRRTLAPLGGEAAHGYALIALAAHRSDRPTEAGNWWRAATLLIDPDRLIADMPDLAALRDLHPADSLAQVMERDGIG